MANLVVSGLPAIAWSVGFVVVGALPVWFGAQVTGASRPTLFRSALALMAGVIGSIVGLAIGGPAALLISPLSFLFSFKFILDMSLLGALMLCIVAAFGGFMMVKFIGGEFSVKDSPSAQVAMTRLAIRHHS